MGPLRSQTGILDTSVVIDRLDVEADLLPAESAITAVTLSELAAGPHATANVIERSIRQERLRWAEATFDALPFDVAAARSYGRVYALLRAARRQPRSRLADLMIASVAAAHQLPVYTRTPTGFAGVESLITVFEV